MNPNQFDRKRGAVQLRKAAEAHLAGTPQGEAPDRSAAELLHELRVHQIELEMQNEELRRAQAALEESRDRYLDLYEFAPIGYLTLAREGTIAGINLTGASLFGMERKKLLHSRFDALIAPQDRDHWYHQFVNMIKHAVGRQKIELELQHGDGSRFYGRLDCLRAETDNAVPQVRIALTNIDELKRAEMLLRASNERTGMLLASTGEGIFAIDEDGLCTIANPACARLLGFASPDELPGRDMHRLMHSRREDGSAFPPEACPVLGVVRTGQSAPLREDRFWRADGSSFPVELSAYPMFRDGVVAGAVVSFNDISERKQAEAALLKSEGMLAAIANAAQDAIALIDDEGNVRFWNLAAEKLFGYSAAEITGRNLHQLLTPQRFREAHAAGFAQFRKTGAGAAIGKTLELAAVARDGREFPVEVSISAVELDGRWHGVGIVRDITARKQAEDQLRLLNEHLEQRVQEELGKNRKQELLLVQQSRLAAIGEVIHNVSHHWRQPLNAVSLILANLKDAYEFHELDQDYLDKEVAGGQRLIQEMSTTIDRFRGFFLPDMEKQNFRVCDEVDEAVKLLAPGFRAANIEIEFAPCPDRHRILGYPGDFARVVLSVLTNARDAIAKKETAGKIRIAVTEDGETVRVSISDNGGGVPAAVLDKVFDPYFTTQDGGNGSATGLGLYLARIAMDEMGGSIALRNRGEGLEVLLSLPLT